MSTLIPAKTFRIAYSSTKVGKFANKPAQYVHDCIKGITWHTPDRGTAFYWSDGMYSEWKCFHFRVEGDVAFIW